MLGSYEQFKDHERQQTTRAIVNLPRMRRRKSWCRVAKHKQLLVGDSRRRAQQATRIEWDANERVAILGYEASRKPLALWAYSAPPQWVNIIERKVDVLFKDWQGDGGV